jgi:DNA-binding response OmpR family regulator
MNADEHVILMVEDDPFDAKLIRRTLRKAEILTPVRHVADGEAAVGYLAGTSPYEDRHQYPLPDLVLLDLKLPRKNGFELLQWLRAQSGLRRVPVVVLTSCGETTDVNRAYDLGANSYLVKPVATDALVDLLKKVEIYWLGANTKPDLDSQPNSGPYKRK